MQTEVGPPPKQTMKSKTVPLVVISIVTLALLVLVLAARGRFKQIERIPATNRDFTDVMLPVSKQTVVDKMTGVTKPTADTDECVMLEGRFAHFRLVNAQDPLFPEDYLLRANSQDNPALQRYLKKDPASKRDDFYLFTPPDFYRPSSEYMYRQRPAEFTSNFIIHLEGL